MKECTCCGAKFMPQEESDELCPDCIEMTAYIARLKNVGYLLDEYKEFRHYQLEYMDRCELFTRLYEHCGRKLGGFYPPAADEPFHFLVLNLTRYKVVVTFLSSDVTGKVRHSKELTMTKFRRDDGARKVRMAIDAWRESSAQVMETSAGKMRILNYPVKLRVQTDYDKNYGKRWNGPYDYVEIGNYGDTTPFWIVGWIEP